MKYLLNKGKSISKGFLYNFKGWKTNRKIIVIESDDWGGERTPNKNIYSKLLKAGIDVDKCPFGKYDTVESKTDLHSLFDVLSSVKDKENKKAVITANFNLANPDFQKIKDYSYNKYFYLDYKDTLEKYNRYEVLETVKQGIKDKVIFPQNHSREHISPKIWLDEIKNGNKSLKKAFELQVYGLSRITSSEIVKFHLASQLFRNTKELEFVKQAMKDGTNLFESIFGYKSKTFIAPVYTWNDENEFMMFQNDIKFIQSSYFQNYFDPFETESFKRKFHFTGQSNRHNQIYTVRNCLFEPSLNQNKDWLNSCLRDIQMAFTMKKPAIISTHRLNYIGSLVEKNRNNNLELLKNLLKQIKKKWPDIEFMTSLELGNLIANEQNV